MPNIPGVYHSFKAYLTALERRKRPFTREQLSGRRFMIGFVLAETWQGQPHSVTYTYRSFYGLNTRIMAVSQALHEVDVYVSYMLLKALHLEDIAR